MKVTDKQTDSSASDEEGKRAESEAKFLEFIAECLEEGWCPTRCGKNCIVEPDGVCPHGFQSIALECGLI